MEKDNQREFSLKSSCRVKIRLALSVIGIVVGLSSGIVFSVHFKNYHAGVWGVFSALVAFTAFCVTVAFIKGTWDSNYHPLRGFMLSGCFIQLAGVCGFVAYLVLAISQQQHLTAYGPGFYIACVWCFVTWKWGFLLLMYSRTYYYTYKLREGILNVIDEAGKRHPYKALDFS